MHPTPRFLQTRNRANHAPRDVKNNKIPDRLKRNNLPTKNRKNHSLPMHPNLKSNRPIRPKHPRTTPNLHSLQYILQNIPRIQAPKAPKRR